MKSYQFKLGSRPVITLSGEPGDWPALIAALDTSTAKRRLVRLGLLAAARLRLIPIIARRLSRESIAELQQLVAASCRTAVEHGRELRSVSVYWPGGDRSHRRYVLSVDAEGAMGFFSKVTVNPDADWHLLRKEEDLLGTLARAPLPGLRTPRVYRAERGQALGSLVMEAIPASRQHLDWPAIRQILPLGDGPGSLLTYETLWLRTALDMEMAESFRNLVERGIQHGVRTGLVNGDVRPNNVVASKGFVWLFDWEYGCTTAPWSTDIVAALLNAKTAHKTAADTERVLAAFRQDVASAGIDVSEAAVCLLYLSTVDHPWATMLAQQTWSAPADLTKDHAS